MPPDKLAAAVEQLAGQLDQITRIVRFEPALLDLRVPRISRWSIGLQIDHILKVLEAGTRLLDDTSQTLPRGMNLIGHLCLATGWIPRGVGKSPKSVLPAEQPPADLAERASHMRKLFCDRPLPEALRSDPRPVFPHPYFGGLSAVEGLRFLGVHTHHHLKIVADIRRSS